MKFIILLQRIVIFPLLRYKIRKFSKCIRRETLDNISNLSIIIRLLYTDIGPDRAAVRERRLQISATGRQHAGEQTRRLRATVQLAERRRFRLSAEYQSWRVALLCFHW